MSPFVGNIGLSVNRTAFMVVLVLMYMAAVTTDVAVTNGGYWWIVFVKCTVNENPACRLHCCCGTRMQRSDLRDGRAFDELRHSPIVPTTAVSTSKAVQRPSQRQRRHR